jgi:hypothetical protein
LTVEQVIIKKIRTTFTAEEEARIISKVPELIPEFMEHGHVQDKSMKELGIPILDSGKRDKDTLSESYERTLVLNHNATLSRNIEKANQKAAKKQLVLDKVVDLKARRTESGAKLLSAYRVNKDSWKNDSHNWGVPRLKDALIGLLKANHLPLGVSLRRELIAKLIPALEAANVSLP